MTRPTSAKAELKWNFDEDLFHSARMLAMKLAVGLSFIGFLHFYDGVDALSPLATAAAVFGLSSKDVRGMYSSRPRRVLQRQFQPGNEYPSLQSIHTLTGLLRFQEVEHSASALLGYEPNNVEALIYLAWAVHNRPAEYGSTEHRANAREAVRHFDRALELQPEHVDALRLRALVHAAKRSKKRALVDIQRAEAIQPNELVLYSHATILRDLASTGFRQDKSCLRLAEEKLRLLLEFNPNNQDAISQLASVYYDLGQPDLAMQTASRALALEPHGQAMYLLGSAKIKLGMVEEGAEDMMMAAQLDGTLTPVMQASLSRRRHVPPIPYLAGLLMILVALGLLVVDQYALGVGLGLVGAALVGVCTAVGQKRYEQLPAALRQKIEA